MKLGIISDIHCDHNSMYDFKNILNRPDLDALIIAGDIDSDIDDCLELLEYLNNKNKLTLVTLGNHDYYVNKKALDTVTIYNQKITNLTNIKLLENTGLILNGYKICGCTGWYPGQFNYNTSYPDFKYISLFESNRQMIYNQSFKFLYANQGPNTIYITHHVPYNFLFDEEIKSEERFVFYSMNLPQILQCKMWIFGHTHMQMDKEINSIRYVNNPFGYYYENLNNDILEIEI